MRKSIFQSLEESKDINIKDEYIRVAALFCTKGVLREMSLNDYCSSYLLKIWKYRSRCVTLDELLEKLEITSRHIQKSNYDLNKVLAYFELVCTFMFMILDCISNDDDAYFVNRETKLSYSELDETMFKLIIENINSFLDDLNYKIVKKDVDRYEIVEKDALATSVAEDNPDVADKVIEYRKYDMKGDIKTKRSILLVLANKIENLDKKFKGTTYKSLYNDTTFLLNNLNIRHNNTKETLYNKLVQDGELEDWYDKTYICILNVLAIDNYLSFNQNIDLLKKI